MLADELDTGPSRDRWLLSWADLLTLLLAFFVVMYSISTMDKGRLAKVSASFGEAFDAAPAGDDATQMPAAGAPTQEPVATDVRVLDELPGPDSAEALKSLLQTVVPGEFSVATGGEWIELSIGASVLFDSASADLRSTGALSELLPFLQETQGMLVVAGHTDNLAIANGRFPSNWELSAARAAAVVRYLEARGIAADRMAAQGHGDSRPLTDNESAQSRAENRRVVLRLRQQGVDRDQLLRRAAQGNQAQDLDAAVPPENLEAPLPDSEEPAEIPTQEWLETIDPAILEEILNELDATEEAPG